MTGKTARPTVAALTRYPVKGLSGERLESTDVVAREPLAFDRAFAIENGRGGFDPAAPRHLPKTAFIMLMRDERLALLDTRFDDASCMLEIRRDGASVARGRLDEPVGRRLIEQFFASFMANELRGPPRVVSSAGHSFSDVDAKCVSIINLASVREISRVAGREVAPERFRGNILIEGLPAWAEFDLVGTEFTIGEVRLAGFKRITRCAATNVDPDSAARDMNIPRLLQQAFGHTECGIYARIETVGTLAVGMELAPPLRP